MPKTLLLADDSVTIQKVVGLTFASEDITLVNVDNGDDALAKARELRPDLVLADVVMPGRNGYEVCEAIKADTALRHIPVLLLSGTFETFDEERARIAGADGHITKPFEAQALIETVHRLLAKPLPAVVRAVAGTDTGPVVLTPARVESHGDASFDFFDDDLLESSNAFGTSAGSSAASGTTGSSRSASAGATPSPSPSLATPASVASEFSRGASGTTTAPSFNSTSGTNERTVLDLREEEAFDLAEAEEDDDVVAATEALFEDDVDLGASIGAPTLDDEEPLDLGFDEAPRPPPPSARLDDPLEALAHSGGSSAPRAAAPLGHGTDVSWPDLGAQPHDAALDARLGSSEFDISFRDTSARGTSAAGTAGFGQGLSAQTVVHPIATSIPVTADAFATPLDAELPAAVAVDSDEDALFADFDAAPLETGTAGFGARDAFDTRPDAGVSFADEEPLSEMSFAGTLTADEEAPLAFSAPDVAEPARAFAAPTRPGASMNETTGARTAPPTTVPPDLGPLLRQRVHDTLEKVAWEAFADLSDTIVRQVVERVESIAWEVIPQMAEAIVREEIRRMKGSEE